MTNQIPPETVVPAASLVGIRKAYPGVVALNDVDLDVRHGEVHALVGENGAGKSTLVKILVGATRPDTGTIILEGRETSLHSTRAARRHGISYIPQDVQAVPGLSVGRNILLGNEHFFSSRNHLGRHEIKTVGTALERAGAVFHASDRADTLSVPELRLAQIARALVSPGDVMVLDEPTAVLSEADAEHLLTRLRSFLADGKAILYVSHRLTEVLQIASRITVLRDGQQVGTFDRDQIDRERIIQLMAKSDRRGRQEVTVRERSLDRAGPPVLEIKDVEREPLLRRVSVEVRAGESWASRVCTVRGTATSCTPLRALLPIRLGQSWSMEFVWCPARFAIPTQLERFSCRPTVADQRSFPPRVCSRTSCCRFARWQTPRLPPAAGRGRGHAELR